MGPDHKELKTKDTKINSTSTGVTQLKSSFISADEKEKISYKTLNKEVVVRLLEQYRQDMTSTRNNAGTDQEKWGFQEFQEMGISSKNKNQLDLKSA